MTILPAGTGAGQRAQVDLRLAGDPPGERRCLARGRPRLSEASDDLPAAAGAGAAGPGWAGAGDPGRGSVQSPMLAITPPIGTVSPSPDEDPQRPVGVRVEHDRRLVGLDLGERLALRDAVAVLLEPADDRALLHRVRQPRHHDLRHAAQLHRDPRALAHRGGDRAGARDERVLERRAVGDRQLVGGEQPGVVEVVEPVLGDPPEQPRAPAAGARPLLDREQAVGPGDRLEHGVEIERPERAQVDDLGLDAVAGKLLGGLERVGHALAGGHDRHVAARGARRARGPAG